MSDETGESIKVRDRRTYGEAQAEAKSPAEGDSSSRKDGATAEQQAAGRDAYEKAVSTCDETDEQERPLPPVDFSTLVLSIAQGALVNLGEVPHPETGEKTVSFALARHNIDLLGLLQEKTRGNLDQEEQQLLENLLYDLRMKYVTQCKGG